MFDGKLILSAPSSFKALSLSLSDISSLKYSISWFEGSENRGFRIVSSTFGSYFKASFILVVFKPFVCIIYYNPTVLS